MSGVLTRLAAAHGIASEYHDIYGTHHRASDTALRTLLAAMGVAADDDEEAEAELRALDAARAAQRIPPLVVLRQHVQPWLLRVCLPLAMADRPLTARIRPEDGRKPVETAFHVVRRHAAPGGDAEIADLDLEFHLPLPPGYHDLELLAGENVFAQTCCAIAPATCHVPEAGQPGRIWGASTQLYGLTSARNWGIGDFTDLGTLVALWGGRGAGVIGVNPLHALYPHAPQQASPYSPSSRLFRNILYLDVEAIAEFRDCQAARAQVLAPHFQEQLAALRAAPLVDYAGVAAAKLPVLELLYRFFQERHLPAGNARAEAFLAYVEAGGEALRLHALFEALQEHFHATDHAVWGWPAWPLTHRHPQAPEVTQFAADHTDRIGFHAWLQWQAELQLTAAAARAKEAGLSIGLCTDLAVSIDCGGAEAWSHQETYALGAQVGAPPDAFNMNGQNWGLPPMVPGRLRDAAFAPFLAMLRANMRHAGALRIDHVMGLARLFWIPAGASPVNGAYVHYPFDDLLGLVALESHRHRCMVIGEDLGTVPDYVRDALAANAILSYRVLIFERDPGGAFRSAAVYPAEALVTASTHDLPTLAGWWAGADIELRNAHGLIASAAEREAQEAERAGDRRQLLDALEGAGLLPAGIGTDPEQLPQMTPPVARSVQSYLAAAPSRLLVVQLEDVVGEIEQANLPGTVDTHPNWRRKLCLPLERWPGDPRFDALAATLACARPGTRP